MSMFAVQVLTALTQVTGYAVPMAVTQFTAFTPAPVFTVDMVVTPFTPYWVLTVLTLLTASPWSLRSVSIVSTWPL